MSTITLRVPEGLLGRGRRAGGRFLEALRESLEKSPRFAALLKNARVERVEKAVQVRLTVPAKALLEMVGSDAPRRLPPMDRPPRAPLAADVRRPDDTVAEDAGRPKSLFSSAAMWIRRPHPPSPPLPGPARRFLWARCRGCRAGERGEQSGLLLSSPSPCPGLLGNSLPASDGPGQGEGAGG